MADSRGKGGSARHFDEITSQQKIMLAALLGAIPWAIGDAELGLILLGTIGLGAILSAAWKIWGGS